MIPAGAGKVFSLGQEPVSRVNRVHLIFDSGRHDALPMTSTPRKRVQRAHWIIHLQSRRDPASKHSQKHASALAVQVLSNKSHVNRCGGVWSLLLPPPTRRGPVNEVPRSTGQPTTRNIRRITHWPIPHASLSRGRESGSETTLQTCFLIPEGQLDHPVDSTRSMNREYSSTTPKGVFSIHLTILCVKSIILELWLSFAEQEINGGHEELYIRPRF